MLIVFNGVLLSLLSILVFGITVAVSTSSLAAVVVLPDKTQFNLPNGFEALTEAQLQALNDSTKKQFDQPTRLTYAASRFGSDGKAATVFNIRAFPADRLTQEHVAQLEKEDPKSTARIFAQGLPPGTTLTAPPAVIKAGKRRAVSLRYYSTLNGKRFYTDTVRLYDGPSTVIATCSYPENVADGASACSALMKSIQ